MKIIQISLKNSNQIIRKTIKLIKEGGVIVCPTDTIYGLIADAASEKAAKKVLKIKKRYNSKPIPIFVKDIKTAKSLAEINEKHQQVLKKVWPGEATVILKRRRDCNLPDVLFGKTETIGLRIPEGKLINALLKELNRPLTGTSANISGKPVIIKKVSKVQEDYLLESTHCKLLQPKSNKLKDQFDDIHPQVVVNLKAFMSHLTSHELYNFQRHLKQFSQRNYIMKTIEPELFDDFWDVILKWKRTFIRRYEEHSEFTDIPQDDDYYINPYFPIFEYYCRNIDNKNTPTVHGVVIQ